MTKNERKIALHNFEFPSSKLYVGQKPDVFPREWRSTAPISWEYIRGCEMIDREHARRYHYCPDFVHIGYVAVDNTTQILLNYLCNKRMGDTNPQSDICCA